MVIFSSPAKACIRKRAWGCQKKALNKNSNDNSNISIVVLLEAQRELASSKRELSDLKVAASKRLTKHQNAHIIARQGPVNLLLEGFFGLGGSVQSSKFCQMDSSSRDVAEAISEASVEYTWTCTWRPQKHPPSWSSLHVIITKTPMQ